MAIDTAAVVIGTAKKYYEEKVVPTGKQLVNAIFADDDVDTSAKFSIDRLIAEPYAVSYRDKDTQSVLRRYEPGTNTQHEVPRASEKTAISEDLRDKVTVGVGETGGFGANEAKRIENIVQQHDNAHKMTKNKQAVDVLSTGEFKALGTDGADLALDLVFGRDAALGALAYDFTAGEASFSEAMREAMTLLRTFGTPFSGLTVLCGENWINEYGKDLNIGTEARNNASNITVTQEMMPAAFQGVEDLNVHGIFRGGAMTAPITVITYTPPRNYKQTPTSSAVPFVDADEALFFSTTDVRYNVMRGVDVFNDAKEVDRLAGEVVFDSYNENDPINTFLRSQTRHALIPANINHTAKSTGTFA
jgi:hypothetical protein